MSVKELDIPPEEFPSLLDSSICPLCADLFTEPRILSCSHTFCGLCISKINTARNVVTCPLCGIETHLDIRGVLGLTLNTALKQKVEELKHKPGIARMLRQTAQALLGGASLPFLPSSPIEQDVAPSAPPLEEPPYDGQEGGASTIGPPPLGNSNPYLLLSSFYGTLAPPTSSSLYPSLQPEISSSAPCVTIPAGAEQPDKQPAFPQTPPPLPARPLPVSPSPVTTTPPPAPPSSCEQPSSAPPPPPIAPPIAAGSSPAALPTTGLPNGVFPPPGYSSGEELVRASSHTEPAVPPLNFAVFKVRPSEAVARLQQWLEGLWFTPSGIEAVRVTECEQRWVPFWRFEAVAHTQYTGEVYVTQPATGPGGRPTAGWRPVQGRVSHVYRNIFICSSAAADRPLLDELPLTEWAFADVFYGEDYKPPPPSDPPHPAAAGFFSRMVRKAADAVASKLSSVVAKPAAPSGPPPPPPPPPANRLQPHAAWPAAWQHYEQKTLVPSEQQLAEQKIRADIPHATHVRRVRVQVHAEMALRRLVYMPVYSGTYVVGGKAYRFVVHGQSGSVRADRPYGLGMMSTVGKAIGSLLFGSDKK